MSKDEPLFSNISEVTFKQDGPAVASWRGPLYEKKYFIVFVWESNVNVNTRCYVCEYNKSSGAIGTQKYSTVSRTKMLYLGGPFHKQIKGFDEVPPGYELAKMQYGNLEKFGVKTLATSFYVYVGEDPEDESV